MAQDARRKVIRKPKNARGVARITSDLTPHWRDKTRARRRIARIAETLARAYGTPDLGNLPDPLEEAAYIILTHQTDIPRARLVWSAFRQRFPTWNAVLQASDDSVANVLRPSGLHLARSRLLRALLGSVVRQFGTPSLEACRSMETGEAERLLRALPGLDRKSARCVLLYSLARTVLPVDSNTHRFALRYGILRPGTLYRRARVHDELQELVPPALRHDFHVNLVVHGQRTCTPRDPRCPKCPLRRSCPTGSQALLGVADSATH